MFLNSLFIIHKLVSEIIASLCFDRNILILSFLLQLLRFIHWPLHRLWLVKKWGDKKSKENHDLKAYTPTCSSTSSLLPKVVLFLSLQRGDRLVSYTHRVVILPPTLFPHILKGEITSEDKLLRLIFLSSPAVL